MTKEYVFGVIGAGNGGKAMAGYLALLGKRVMLYNRTFSHVEVIAERQGIDLINPGGLEGFGKLEMVTDNIGDLLAEAQVIMVVTPSSAHRDIAKAAKPYLRDDHTVILNPGRTGGALEFTETLRQNGCTTNPIISEAETFIFASRSEGPNLARIFRIKESVSLAALPANRTKEALNAIHTAFPQYINGGNVLMTGLNNMGAVFHVLRGRGHSLSGEGVGGDRPGKGHGCVSDWNTSTHRDGMARVSL